MRAAWARAFLVWGALVAVATTSGSASADVPGCVPGTPFCAQWGPAGPQVIVRPPPVQGGMQGGGGAGAHGQAQAQAQARAALEAQWRAEWDAYLAWRANIAVQVDVSVRARLQAQARAALSRTPDPYAMRPLYVPPPTYPDVTFPRLSLGLLGLCFGHFLGDTAAVYAGYCPSVRYRVGALAIALDPAMLAVEEARVPYGAFALRPGVTYALVRGRNETWGSELYVSAGLDVYVPTGPRRPSAAFFGAHGGLGVQATDGTWVFGAEWRLTSRVAFEPALLGDGTATNVSAFRLGSEARFFVGFEF
ncbi:MAG: hypothetical protein IPK71_15230 [Myxococcales bacterium]|nr:hypothetical protein [Myxococcales bacterium]